MKVLKSNDWSIVVPEDWQNEVDGILYTFYHQDGYGALQVSTFIKEVVVTDEDLKEHASEHINAGATIKSIESDSMKVFGLEFGLDGEYWQYWYMGIGNIALIVTYHCDESDREKESTIVKAIVSSINKT